MSQPGAEPQQFGRYRVTRELGSGAMGAVYEAVDDVLGREVAIKTLRVGSGAILLDERFKVEARAIAKLSHPNVVQVFDIDLAVDPPYLVLERVAGPSLGKRLESGALPASEIVRLGIQLSRALAAAHAAGIVHRDVKPANILAGDGGTWKLADFGVAHVPDASLTITGQFVGSPAYAPPEALVKGTVSPAGDIYGLGASLYEAAAGRWPRLEAKGALLAPVPPLAQLAPHLPPDVAAAIDRAVALDADLRPSAGELADLLANAGTPRDSAPIAAVVPPQRRKWLLYAGLALAALVLLAIVTDRGKPAPQADLVRPVEDGETTNDPSSEAAAHDWNKIADDVRKGHYPQARRKLDDWERHYGETDESRQLRDQLPEDVGPPGRKHGKHGD